MKKFHSLALFVAILIFGAGFTSCSDDNDDKTDTQVKFRSETLSAGFKLNEAGSFDIIVDVKSPNGTTVFTIAKGELPAGLTLVDNSNNTATISGTPTEAGTTTVTIGAMNNKIVASKEMTITVSETGAASVADIAGFIAAANSTDLVSISGEVTVVYANEYTNDKGEVSQVFIQDASGYIQVYGYALTGVKVGDRLIGLSGKYTDYQGTLEITEPVYPVAVAGAAPSPFATTVGELSTAAINRYVSVKGVTISSEIDGEYTNYYASKDGAKVQVYDKFRQATPVDGQVCDIEGIIVGFTSALNGIELAPLKITAQATGSEVGDGTEANPYNIAAAKLHQSGFGYVTGTIVGVYNFDATEQFVFGVDTIATSILIADNSSASSKDQVMAVQLPSGAIRDALNLKDNAGNLTKTVTLYGSLEAYCGIAGVKSVSYAKLDGTEYGTKPVDVSDAIYFAELISDFGTMLTYSEEGDAIWGIDATYKCAKMTGYSAGNRYANKDWLYTPSIDLSSETAATLSFEQSGNYFSNVLAETFIMVSTDFSGDVTTASWTPLLVTPNIPGDGFAWVTSSADLSSFAGESNVTIAFKYLSTTEVAGTWEIKNVAVL